MSKNLTSKRKKNKHWRPQQKITWHQKEIEDEAEAEAEAEEAMIVATNNNTTSTKTINFKEEEEDEVVIIQHLIDQSQQTSPMLNAADVIGMAIISQNVELIWIGNMEKELTLQKKKKRCLFWWCVMWTKKLNKTCGI